ncbi:MAG TPA: DNA polymerase III subunit gamma/tau [Lachnospiraceae bacterium]
MSYMALYRKFRPNIFSDVKGQDHIVTTLKNQIKADRIGHAYLFCGTRGTGKTTIAKILAKAVNCQNPKDGSPCNQCESCKNIQEQRSLNVIEIDAASNNGVDNIREIIEEISYRPTQGKYKVYIIDEVHMLSTGAFNALLKTLEEPPEYVIFILATTEANKIPITILSRCQRYDFKRITVATIANRLTELMKEEKIEVKERAITYIAKMADGSMRDALSLLDQCLAFYMGETLSFDNVLEVLGTVDTEVFSDLLRYIMAGQTTMAVKLLEKLIVEGKELVQFVADFTWYLRNLLLAKTGDSVEEVVDASTETIKRMLEEIEVIDNETLMRYIRIFSELSGQIRFATQKRVLVEIALIKLCKPQMEVDVESLLDRIRTVEKELEQIKDKGIVVSDPISKEDSNLLEELKEGGEEKKPVKAASEDLQKIKADWASIIAETKGMFHSMLLGARPKYNGDVSESKLYVEFANALGGHYYMQHPEAKKELADIILKRYGKSIEIEFVVKDDKNNEKNNLSDIRIEDILEREIKMEIEIED